MLKKNLTSKIFLFLVTATAIFITVSGFLTSGGENLIFQILFLPVTAYLLYASFQAIKHTNLEVILSQKKGGLFFFFILFFALTIIAVSHLAQTKEKVIIKTPNPETKINVQETASTSSKIIGKVGQGEEFILIKKEGEWYQIKFENSFGYLYKEYVAVLED